MFDFSQVAHQTQIAAAGYVKITNANLYAEKLRIVRLVRSARTILAFCHALATVSAGRIKLALTALVR